MMPTGLFSQLALIILSLGIIFTYIKPALGDIKETQNSVALYKEAHANIEGVNNRIEKILGDLRTIDSNDQKRLLTYLPDEVDTVAVLRDIKAIADRSGVVVREVGYVGPEQPPETSAYVDPAIVASAPSTAFDPEAHTFSISFDGSYEQLKSVVRDLERNAYPLEVRDLQVEEAEGGFLAVSMNIDTYDRINPEPPVSGQ